MVKITLRTNQSKMKRIKMIWLKTRVTMLMKTKKMLALLKWRRNKLLKKKHKKVNKISQIVRKLRTKMETMKILRKCLLTKMRLRMLTMNNKEMRKMKKK